MRIQTGGSANDHKLRLDLKDGAGFGSTTCPGAYDISGGVTSLNIEKQITSTTFTDYVFEWNSKLASAKSHLWVNGNPLSFSNTQDIYIRRIKIEVLEWPELELSPTSVNVTCGSTNTQTFTVSNPNNIQNITSYEWHLFNSNNGWNYNGSAAAQDISTTTNSISLTPTCGVGLQNVRVTVKVNNVNYKTYTANVSVPQPSMSVNGVSYICNSTSPQTYFITNLPCNATVSWAASPLNKVSISTSNNQATLTKIGEGEITLTGTVTSCGQQTPVNLTVTLGVPATPTLIEIYGNGSPEPWNLCETGYRMEVSGGGVGAGTVTGYEWELPGNWTSTSNPGSSNPFTVTTSTGFDIQVSVTAIYQEYVVAKVINSCGASNPALLEVTTCCNCRFISNYIVSPNPVKNYIHVKAVRTAKPIKEIQIVDKQANILRRYKYKIPLKAITLSAFRLKPDMYYLRIFDGKNWEVKAILIR